MCYEVLLEVLGCVRCFGGRFKEVESSELGAFRKQWDSTTVYLNGFYAVGGRNRVRRKCN